MDTGNQKKVRLSIDCTPEERKFIRLLAAMEDKGVAEYLLSLARQEFFKINLINNSMQIQF